MQLPIDVPPVVKAMYESVGCEKTFLYSKSSYENREREIKEHIHVSKLSYFSAVPTFQTVGGNETKLYQKRKTKTMYR